MSESIPPLGTLATLPILPLRNSVLFPSSVVPVNVGRPRSVRLIEEAFENNRPTIGVVAQRDPEVEEPEFEDLHSIGTITRVLKVIRLSSGTYSVVLQGAARMRITAGIDHHPCLRATVERIAPLSLEDLGGDSQEELQALAAHLHQSARELFETIPGRADEILKALNNVKHPAALSDLIASNLNIDLHQKQQVMELLEIRPRIRKVIELVNRQREVLRVKGEISTMVQEEMSRSQREYLLRQQLRSIRRELGEATDEDDELEQLRDQVIKAELPKEADRAARRQLSRLRTMATSGSEYHLTRQYVEWLTELPWNRSTPDRLDVKEARRVLDEDHHGLEKIKRRIVEYMAVRKLRSDKSGPILCLVGPPGVGKTSLAKSIARATGRSFVRVSLGGVHDEGEIRGHRRTYVGSFPGRIVGGLKKAQSKNPVMLLDEVDKLGSNQRGDPAAALLEVLDPQQNKDFVDHYIEVSVNLSQVLFVCTANRQDTIPAPLRDRMEMIEIAGYTLDEKFEIAVNFLIPKQLAEHGLTPETLDFLDEGVRTIIEDYTREAGVRNLEKKIASICRHVAVELAQGNTQEVLVGPEQAQEILGPPRHSGQRAERRPAPGVAASLVWLKRGGELVLVETSRMPGKGRIHLTGSMGNILKEAAATSFSYVRTRATELGLPEDFLEKIDVHVHFPQGALPKDGPSTGVAIVMSMISMLTGVTVRPDVAMIGEITLRGNLLPVNGIKQRCLASHRAGIKTIVLPARNEPDLEEIPKNIRDDMKFVLTHRVEEAIAVVLTEDPRLPIQQNPEHSAVA